MEDMLHRPISIEHPSSLPIEIHRQLANKCKAWRIRRQKTVETPTTIRLWPMGIWCSARKKYMVHRLLTNKKTTWASKMSEAQVTPQTGTRTWAWWANSSLATDRVQSTATNKSYIKIIKLSQLSQAISSIIKIRAFRIVKITNCQIW